MQLFGKRRNVVLAVAVLVLFWGSAFSVVKVGLEHSPPMIFAGLRTLIGGLVILLVAFVWGGSPHLRRDWPVFLLFAAFNVVFFFGFQTLAILHLPSGTAAVLEYLQPVLVGLLAWVILGESLSLAKLIGLVLGFSGIVAVSSGSIFGNISPVGVAFGVGSAFSWALGTVFFKRYEARISTMWAVALPFVMGGMVVTLFGFAIESWSEVSPTAMLITSLSYVSLVEIALAWLIWFGLIRAGEAIRVAVYGSSATDMLASAVAGFVKRANFRDNPVPRPCRRRHAFPCWVSSASSGRGSWLSRRARGGAGPISGGRRAPEGE